MVNAVSEHTSTMPEKVDVLIPICHDDDDDNDDPKVDKEYKSFLDRLGNGNSLGIPFEDDNGECETRNSKFGMFSGDSKRSSLGNETPVNNRVSQERKRKSVVVEAEVSRAFPFSTIRESIHRDNRVAERRKRKMDEFEAEKVSRAVPSVRNQQNSERDNKAGKTSEPEVETVWDDPLVRIIQDIQRGIEARKLSESKVETLWDVPLVVAKEDIQRDCGARRMSESKVDTLWDVPLVVAKEDIKRDCRARRMSESKVDTLWDVPLVVAKEATLGDQRIDERGKKKTEETQAAKTSRVVPVDQVTETNAVDETSRFVPVTQDFEGTRKKNEEKSSAAVVDKDYMSYLTWLVDSHKDSTAEPGPSNLDPPVLETRRDSTVVPEKDLLAKVKIEQHLKSWYDDDDDIIAVSDTPFSDGEGTPFVVSRSRIVIDLEQESTEDESSNTCFKKKLMEVLEKPYDKRELSRLSREVSIKKRVTRWRELRKGREGYYETDDLGPSYLEKVSDFDEEYKRVDGDDKARLKLLRGFFFYLQNVSQVGAFKPWLPENQSKLR
ncbi:unnamed protein product [Thlaspi arvense]|uniref:Uncharacterized protein n=1 Tax=Thlaspi arvense TaxID=13288 RepID=A0AAU9S511_THLAR|nr:unnamed protein product [Thlaspi arvense]